MSRLVAVSGRLIPTSGFAPGPVARELAAAIRLTSKGATAMIEEALTAGRYEATVDGASTIVLDLVDEDRVILTSPIATQRTTITISGRTYTLVRVSPQGSALTLTFEPAAVTAMRNRRGKRVTVAGKVSRIGFIRSLCREARVPVWTPANDPVPTRRSQPAAAAKRQVREETPGFAKGAGRRVRVKRQPATSEQLSVITQVLEACWRYTARYPVDLRERGLVMTLMAITQEQTARNLPSGHLDSVGAFQQRPSSGYRNPMNLDLATKDFLFNAPGRPAAFEVLLKNQGRSLGWCISEAQRDESWGKQRQGDTYDQWRTEAEATVRLWLGGVKLSDAPVQALRSKRLSYSRDDGESSWDATVRLATEIGLRAFEQAGRIVVADDLSLMARAGDIAVTPGDAWVTDVAFDFDIGAPVAEARVAGTVDAATVLPGRSCELTGYGPGDGRWLVKTVTQGLYTPQTDITLTRPQPVLPEPESAATPAAARRRTRALGGALAAGARAGTATELAAVRLDNRYAGTQAIFEQFINPFLKRHGLTANNHKRPRKYTASGNISDHWVGNTTAYAGDYGTTAGAAAATALARAMGWTSYRNGSYAHYRFMVGGVGFSAQILWAVAGHFDHIHVGIRRI